MPDEQTEPQKEQSQEKQSHLSKMLSIAAFPISAIASAMYAIPNIRQGSFDRFRRKGVFSEIVEKHHNKWLEEDAKVISGEINDMKPFVKENTKSFTAEINKEFGKKGFNHWWEHYGALNPAQTSNIWEKSSAVFAVSLGVLLTIANSKGLLAMIDAEDAAKNDKTVSKTASR